MRDCSTQVQLHCSWVRKKKSLCLESKNEIEEKMGERRVSQHVSGGERRPTLTEPLRRVRSMSQVPQLHSSTHKHALIQVHTPAAFLPRLGCRYTQEHMRSNGAYMHRTRSNFQPAKIKFLLSGAWNVFSSVIYKISAIVSAIAFYFNA